VGDTKLDWHGAEPGQGTYEGDSAGGSPTAWTTNDQSGGDAYHALNRSAHTFCIEIYSLRQSIKIYFLSNRNITVYTVYASAQKAAREAYAH